MLPDIFAPRVGRPPKYDFYKKLQNIGDFMVIKRFDRERARNAASQFKKQMKAKGEDWFYSSETLPNGDVMFIRTDGKSTPLDKDRNIITQHNNKKIIKNILDKNTNELLNEDMPYGIWYCVPEIEDEKPMTVLFNRSEVPILEKLAGTNNVRPANRTEWGYRVTLTGWFYHAEDDRHAMQLSGIYLMKWLYGEEHEIYLVNSVFHNEPHYVSDRPFGPNSPVHVRPSTADLTELDTGTGTDDEISEDAEFTNGFDTPPKA